MPKTAGFEGTLYKNAKGKWVGDARLAGKRRTVTRATRSEAAKALGELIREMEQGIAPARGSLAEYLDEWLQDRRKQLRPATYLGYQALIRDHIKPALGHRKVGDITARDVQRWLDDMLRDRAPNTVRNARTVLHRAYRDGVRFSGLPVNPVASTEVRARKEELGQVEVRHFDPDLIRAIVGALGYHPHAALYSLLAHTGMRLGEAMALQWKHVDLAGGTVRIEQSLSRSEHGPMIGPTKTKESRRIVRLPQEYLRSQYFNLKERRDAAGPDALVFPNRDGRPLSQSHVHRTWLAFLREHGFAPMRLHDLRHAMASYLVSQAGKPGALSIAEVSRLLGHRDPAITLSIYTHAMPTIDRERADAITWYEPIVLGGLAKE